MNKLNDKITNKKREKNTILKWTGNKLSMPDHHDASA